MPENNDRLKIGITVGYTIKVGDWDFAKPTVTSEIQFDPWPDEKTTRERWRWLWDTQIGPQSEELLDFLVQELTKRLGDYHNPSLPDKAAKPAPPPPAAGGAYE